MFTGFKNQQMFFERTTEFFESKVGLKMRNAKPFGGYGNLRVPRTAVQGEKLVVGEHAGFQDALVGFGMTYTLRSGILAARSLLEKLDYTALWRKELLPLLHTSIANRYVFNIAGNRGRRWALARHIAGGNARESLRRLYRPWWLSRAILPIALRRYRAPLKGKSCDHVNCNCVWCEHGVV